MDFGSIFLILALLILVVLFVSRPFFDRTLASQSRAAKKQDHELSRLLAERDRVLNALQELDFDYTLGKIPEEDYPEQRQRMMQYGADILRQIDEIQGISVIPEMEKGSSEAKLETALAARPAIAAYNGGNGAGVVPAAVASPDDDLEVSLANRRRQRQDKATGFCPGCGSPLQQSDRFCPKCGSKI